MSKVVIIGCEGQDGRLLYELLEQEDALLIGLEKTSIRTNQNKYQVGFTDISNYESVASLVSTFQPDEVYHLAAFHNSAEDIEEDELDLWEKSYQINTRSLFNFLESIRQYSKKTKLFYAASSHIFGVPQEEIQDENTPVNPITPYGITKAAGMFLCRSYRRKYGMFAAVGILYNHESVYRSRNFISAKIVNTAVQIKKERQGQLIVGNLKASADWGYAPDYVRAMKMILELPEPEDFVVATGEKNTVQKFIEIAFEELGLNWRSYVKERNDILFRDSPVLIGNSEKLRRFTGWRPSVSFEQMVQALVSQKLGNTSG